MPSTKTSSGLVAPLTKSGTIDHRYKVPQHVKKDGTRDKRTNIVTQSSSKSKR